MEINVETLSEMKDRLGPASDKAALLAAGALAGLAVKGKFTRRLLGLGCAAVAASAAIPAVTRYLEKAAEKDEPVIQLTVERGEEPDAEPIFDLRVDVDREEPKAETETAPEA